MFEPRRHDISPATSVRTPAANQRLVLCLTRGCRASPASRLTGQLDEVDVTESAVVTAAYNGHLAVVKYVMQPRSPATAHAVSCNHRDAPRSHAHNCPAPLIRCRRVCACGRLSLDQLESARGKVPDIYDDEDDEANADDAEARAAAATERLQACKKFIAVRAPTSSRRHAQEHKPLTRVVPVLVAVSRYAELRAPRALSQRPADAARSA